MIRTIRNIISGRKFESEEEVNLRELLQLLHRAELESGKITKAKYNAGNGWEEIEGDFPKVRAFIESNFQTTVSLGTPHYTDINHQVYGGKKDEAHYIDINQGELSFANGETKKEKPKRRASIEYLVEKEEAFVI